VSELQEPNPIKKLVAQASEDRPQTDEERSNFLHSFETYECWAPYVRLLKKSIASKEGASFSDFIRLARVQNRFLEEINDSAATCAQAVKTLSVTYRTFTEEALPVIVEPGNWTAEAIILEAIYQSFTKNSDSIPCLERLSLLYEKRTHDDPRLESTYQRLLALDPKNLKALRFFKVAMMQNNAWDEVVKILKTLMSRDDHPRSLFREAQELAGIYLYQLDQPQKAVEVLEEHCVDSPLDTSNILYDAYHRIGNWEGCLRVLRECILGASSDATRSILLFKVGQLEEQLGNKSAAADSFQKAAKLGTDFLEPLEHLVNLAVETEDWNSLAAHLLQLRERVKDESLKEKLTDAHRRLTDGVQRSN